MTEAGPSPTGDGSTVVEALDWRAGRTWAVFVSVVFGYGVAASILATALKLFILLGFDHLDIEKMKEVSLTFFLAMIIAASLIVAWLCPRLLTGETSWMQRPGRGKPRTSWFLVFLWLGPTALMAWWLHGAFFTVFDFGPKAQFPMTGELGFTIVLGTPLLEALLERWGQRMPSRDH